MRNKRSAVIVAALATVVAALGSLPAALASTTSRPASSHAGLAWHTCDKRFRCASLAVPISYGQPNGPSLKLAIIMLPATARKHAIDLVLNPGGPGGSGVSFLEQTGSSFPATLRAQFNLVSFDPRGVGASDPVHCVSAAQLRQLMRVDPAPTTKSEIAAMVLATKGYVADCVAHNSHALLANVGSITVARDMDRLRAALGDAKLTYLGFSYGTYLGELYAEMFPTRTRAIVLDGVINPALSTTASNIQQAKGFETDLNAFFAWCDTNKSCHHALPQGARAEYNGLFSAFDRGQTIPADFLAKYGGRQSVDLGVAELGVIGSLYTKSSWPTLGQALAQAVRGNGDYLAAIAFSYEGLQLNGQFSNEMDANTAVNCVDRPSPKGLSTYEGLARRFAAIAPHFGASEAWGPLICAYWPIPPQGKVGPIHAAGAPTILVIGSTEDPATPYSGAIAVAHQLNRAVLLTRQGAGHTAYLFSACIQRWTDRYLTTLSPPPAHTSCPSNA